MISESGNWTDYRARFGLLPEDEIDLHRGRRDPRHCTYDDAMADVEQTVRIATSCLFTGIAPRDREQPPRAR
jgi:hypothetical protein